MMENKIGGILMLIAPQVVDLIAKNYNLTESAAAEAFYRSKVYSLLEKETTKMWHYSPLTLYTMYDEEKKTGKITFPEEA